MTIVRGFLLGLSALVLLATLPASADVLIMEGKPVVVERADQPTRGMHERTVISRFGEPEARHPAVGQPPISRWDFDGYSVFFEGPYVLHTVVGTQRPDTR